jgi:micrococcal nuclease
MVQGWACYNPPPMQIDHRPLSLLLATLLTALLTGGCPTVLDDDDSAGDDDGADDDAGDDDDSWYNLDPATLPAGPNPCQSPALAEVLQVFDGDTALMDMPSGPHESVRFIGINTPETGYNGSPDECYAQEAKTFAEEQLYPDLVWLTFDGECRDPYDRLLAYIHTRDGFFEIGSLAGGFARTLAIAPNTSFADDFAQVESAAMATDAGLWGVCED